MKRWFILGLCIWFSAPALPRGAGSVRFIILGDRTGEEQPGVYEKVLRAATAENPDFILSVGDTIQGFDDARAEREWQDWNRLAEPFRKFQFYLTPGNHDIWSGLSERLYRKYSRRPLHYSFDSGSAHFTVLDNSRAEEPAASELSFLEEDLKTHPASQPKFVISHRPSWALKALTRDPDFAIHRLARKYGAAYVVAGHIHQMLHYSLEGVEYVSVPSSGGHLRDSGRYLDGWFFGYASVTVTDSNVQFQIHELAGRVTNLNDWGPAGHR